MRDHLDEALHVVLVTDPTPGLEATVEAALQGGCRCVQLRDKHASARDLLGTARRLREITAAHGALLIVNDRFDIALAAGADGVHVGPNDLPVASIRGSVPSSFLIGASCDEPAVARQLQSDGADYVGCGTVFPTLTKPDAGDAIGVDRLRAVTRAVSIPVVAIGGVTESNVHQLSGAGAVGVAVVGAIMNADDPVAVARALKTHFLP